MSIIGNMNYEMYKAEYEVPEWMRNERYEYCEDFYEAFHSRALSKLQKFAASLFQFIL